MNRALACFVLGLVALSATPALAARESWSGKDADGARFSYNNTSGDSWTSIEYSKSSLSYETVAVTSEYIELKDTGGGSGAIHVRLYSDRAMSLQAGSKFKWVEIARGSWKR